MKDYQKELVSRQTARLYGSTSKSQSHAYFKAKKNHKKMPEAKAKTESKESNYKRMSIEEFEKKYGIK